MPASQPHLTGRLFAARFEYLKQLHGTASIARVMDALVPEDRRRLEGVDREAWYPLELLMRFDRVIARVVAPDDPRIYQKLGAFTARHRMEWLGDHAALVSVHGFLTRAAEDHLRFHTFGEAAYHRRSFTEGELRYWGYPLVDEVWCQSGIGFLRACVELITRAPATCDEPQCQARGGRACVFVFRWSPHGELAGGEAAPR